jgi:hypothetical protein
MSVNVLKHTQAAAEALPTIIQTIPTRIPEPVQNPVVMRIQNQEVIFMEITALIVRSNNI